MSTDTLELAIQADGLKKLEDCEGRIGVHIDSAAREFKLIRDDKLFTHSGYGTWSDYCVNRWGSSKASIDRIIIQEWILDNISDVVPQGTRITNEVATELCDLTPEQQREAAAQLPQGKRKPSRKDARKARADAGLPPKPKRKARKVLSESNSDSGSDAERSTARPSVSGYFDNKPESHRIAQDASAPETASDPSPIVEANGHASQEAIDAETWLPRFHWLRQQFVELFGLIDVEGIGETGRDEVIQGLRSMAAAVPDSIAWVQTPPPVETASDLAVEFMELWNAAGMTKMRAWTKGRGSSFNRALKDTTFREHWREAIAIAGKLKGLCSSKQCDVDWFFRTGTKHTVNRLLEGFYSTWTKAEHGNRMLDKDYGESGELK